MTKASDARLNEVTKTVYGMSRGEAHEQRVCVSCRTPVPVGTLGLNELRAYSDSGLCPACTVSPKR